MNGQINQFILLEVAVCQNFDPIFRVKSTVSPIRHIQIDLSIGYSSEAMLSMDRYKGLSRDSIPIQVTWFASLYIKKRYPAENYFKVSHGK